MKINDVIGLGAVILACCIAIFFMVLRGGVRLF